MKEIHTRQLSADDYAEIVVLWQRAGLPVKTKGRDSREELTRQMKDNPEFFLGAEIEHKLVGVIVVSSDGRKGYLNRIAVDPDYRNQGIAQSLTLAGEQALREKGIKVITLLIHENNISSIQLAHKLGYVKHSDIIYFSKRDSDED